MILQNATITSKLQFTIPMLIARKIGIKSGEKVQVAEEQGRIVITPVKQLLTELEGILPTPRKWKGKNINVVIKNAKNEYFNNKQI